MKPARVSNPVTPTDVREFLQATERKYGGDGTSLAFQLGFATAMLCSLLNGREAASDMRTEVLSIATVEG